MVREYLILSAILFSIGVVGVLIRRNALVVFMAIELMLNAVNIAFVSFARHFDALDGQIFVFFVLTVAAAEVTVGLAVIIGLFRLKRTVDVTRADEMKG